MQGDEYVTAAEVAKIVRVSHTFLCRARKQGRGPAYTRLGRKILYRRADVEAWVAENTYAAGQAA